VIRNFVIRNFVSVPCAAAGQLQPQSRQSARLSLQSSELGPQPPHSQGECAPPSLRFREGTHSLAGGGVGGPNSDEGTGTVVL
jgi:hypothetical protein